MRGGIEDGSRGEVTPELSLGCSVGVSPVKGTLSVHDLYKSRDLGVSGELSLTHGDSKTRGECIGPEL